jgi:hypothetical protein
MPVSHFLMFVKLVQWLDGFALKALFRTDHVEPPVL